MAVAQHGACLTRTLFIQQVAMLPQLPSNGTPWQRSSPAEARTNRRGQPTINALNPGFAAWLSLARASSPAVTGKLLLGAAERLGRPHDGAQVLVRPRRMVHGAVGLGRRAATTALHGQLRGARL